MGILRDTQHRRALPGKIAACQAGRNPLNADASSQIRDWVVVKGTARVTNGKEERLVGEGESNYIGATTWHRLENQGKVPLELIEVQIGTYLGEDDIVRAGDVYNRAPEETK